jgi:hypothetical protein
MHQLSGWISVILATVVLAGCQTIFVQRAESGRKLTGFEMDRITAGSAIAVNDATARALGSEVETKVLGNASSSSGTGPVAGVPLLDYANSQASGSARGNVLTETRLSSYTSVDRSSGGALIEVTAGASGTRRAQVNAQFYGFSVNHADVVFGSVTVVACCGADAGVQAAVNTRIGGPYSREVRGVTASNTSDPAQSRIDIAVVSSTLPIIDPAQVSVANSSTRTSPKY